MGKTLIYRDQESINGRLRDYRQTVPVLQQIINQLNGNGFTLTGSSVLVDLASGGKRLRESVKRDIASEVSKIKLLAAKEQAEKEAELLPIIDEAVDKVRRALRRWTPIDIIELDIYNFTYSKLKVGLVSDIEDIIIDEFSIYDTDPAVAEAYRLAGELRDKINDFEAYLRQHGEVLHPINPHNVINTNVVGLISCSPSGSRPYALLNEWAFSKVRTRYVRK